MPGSQFGRAFVVTTFGESHGPAVGCVVDGMPAGVALDVADVQAFLDRRRPGQNHLMSQRKEADTVELLSGVWEGRTLGTPICAMVRNQDKRSKDYADWQGLFRPGHADFTWQARFGHRDPRGGGRASARETVGRVAAGAMAEQLLAALATAQGLPAPQIVAWVQQIGTVQAECRPLHEVTTAAVQPAFAVEPSLVQRTDVDASVVRCPDPVASAAMVEAIELARRERDSLGGVVRCVVRNLPAGLGDPVYDKLTGLLAHALASLPAVRGVQFGSGFAAVTLRASQHNDAFVRGPSGEVATTSNHHGGMLGGISSGQPLLLEVAFKPVATIPQAQQGIGLQGPPQPLTVLGRHDPCVLPRAPVLVEAAVATVLADAWLRLGQVSAGAVVP
jgi:chorismate synthase